MTFVIDGHNLIGVMPDIHLADPDDEHRLLARLRAYRARSGGPPMIVFFDGARSPAGAPGRGQPADPSSPGIPVRFAAPGQIADDAIEAYLRAQPEPGQFAVVTNDQELAARARGAGASVVRASDFALRLARRPRARPAEAPETPDPRAPGFADLYSAFMDAEMSRGRFSRAERQDPATWVERLYGDDAELAQQAARWLGQFGGPRALAPLRDALTHQDVRVRAAALLALGNLGDLAALPDLCDRLVRDAGSLAREAAAQSLGRIGDRTVESLLADVAKNDPKGKVRKAAQAALAQIRARLRGGAGEAGRG